MNAVDHPSNKIKELEELLVVAERKSDILTNLLKEASAEYEQSLGKISISEANFRAVYENAPEAIYIIDTDTRKILDCNPFTVDWLGYTREELTGMPVERILEPGAQGIPENIRKAIDHGLVRIQERRFMKKDGSIVDAEITGTRMEYQGKKCFVALVRDVTERKQIEALFRYKELFESVSDPVFINDSQGRFLEVNDVACDSFGFPREQLLRMTVKDLARPGQSDLLFEMGSRIQKGEIVQFELEMITCRGLSIPFEFHARTIAFKGRPAVLSVARNLSGRKKMEETLIKAERLSAVGEMASGVAHNFNNLLQMIMGGAEAALAKLDAGKIREGRDAIHNIINASQRGADVVRRIKDFTFAKSGDMEQAKVFDLDELVQEAVELTQPLWKDPSTLRRFRVNHIRGRDCFVKGKPSEIFEVLVNLIKNGLEAMPQGGFLTISSYIQSGQHHLSITDTGHGILEEHFQRIFEPFFTTKGTRSSGLGLSSCYGIVKRHQGEMQVKSIPGQGTTFTVVLPAADRPSEIHAPKKPLPEGGRLKFLLIDDEINILKMMEMFFEDTPVRIVTAVSAAIGLEALQQNGFDVVLCDLGMDDINGLEVAKRIKHYCRVQGIPKIPFLLYTGLDKELDVREMEQCGVDRVVNKPTPCEELLRIIQEVVGIQSPTKRT